MRYKNYIIAAILFLFNTICKAQTLQSVVNNGNSTTLPIKLLGRTDIGELYDPLQYGALQIARTQNQGDKFHLSFIRAGTMIYGMGFLNNSNTFGIQPGSSNTSQNGLFITPNGDVGIGTIDTRAYKLAVAGSMVAESINVKLQTAWPDYVFNKQYILLELDSVEKHINEKGHLPGVPSANEVKVEGINIGEMNIKLLRKVEELTLYLIQQNKLISKVIEENKSQQSQIENLKSNRQKK